MPYFNGITFEDAWSLLCARHPSLKIEDRENPEVLKRALVLMATSLAQLENEWS